MRPETESAARGWPSGKSFNKQRQAMGGRGRQHIPGTKHRSTDSAWVSRSSWSEKRCQPFPAAFSMRLLHASDAPEAAGRWDQSSGRMAWARSPRRASILVGGADRKGKVKKRNLCLLIEWHALGKGNKEARERGRLCVLRGGDDFRKNGPARPRLTGDV